MVTTAVIIQSNYIPWKGYFDLLAAADTVVFFDSVQSTKNDWRNRNLIKSPTGKHWLTIPIRHSNTLRIRDVEVASLGWHRKHLDSVRQNYARAPHASAVLPLLEEWYRRAALETRLAVINRIFLRGICALLGVGPRFVEIQDIMSDAEHDALQASERLVLACQRVGTDRYISGPAAAGYLQVDLFEKAGIGVDWFDYNGYPEYPQLHGPFEHGVSILDVLLMVGAEDAPHFALRPGTRRAHLSRYRNDYQILA